jgi:hypothetical protein
MHRAVIPNEIEKSWSAIKKAGFSTPQDHTHSRMILLRSK